MHKVEAQVEAQVGEDTLLLHPAQQCRGYQRAGCIANLHHIACYTPGCCKQTDIVCMYIHTVCMDRSIKYLLGGGGGLHQTYVHA